MMKEHLKLPDYLIDENGNVFHKSNGLPVPLVKGQYALRTAEEFTTSRGKKILLTRRLSQEDIKGYYKTATDIIKHVIVSPSEGKDTGLINKVKIKIDKPAKVSKNVRGVIVDGEKYASASEAAKCLKTSVNTVINRCNNKRFENYNFV